jgi:hypothetical protein
MAEKFVTLAEYNNVNEAYVIKSRLEAAGIRVFLENENTNSVLGIGGFARVKLNVLFEDSFKAMDVLYED